MERDESLIEAMHEYPYLYNSHSSENKVQSKKENASTAIGTIAYLHVTLSFVSFVARIAATKGAVAY